MRKRQAGKGKKKGTWGRKVTPIGEIKRQLYADRKLRPRGPSG